MSLVEAPPQPTTSTDSDFKSAKIRGATHGRIGDWADDYEATSAEIVDACAEIFERTSDRRRREALAAVRERFPRAHPRVGRGNRKRVA